VPIESRYQFIKQNPPANDYSKRLDSRARGQEARFERAFREAIDNVQANIDEDQLREALARGPEAAVQYVNQQITEQQFENFVAEFVAVAGIGATLVLRFLNIDATPADLDALTRQQYVQQVVAELTSNTQRGVAQAIRREDATARKVMNKIGLTPSQEQAVDNFQRMLEEGDGDAFRRTLRDHRFDPSVRRAVEGQVLSQEKIDRMVQRYRERYLRHRAQTVARTESIRAVHAGQQSQIEDLIARGELRRNQIRLYWRNQGDSRVRMAHNSIPRQNEQGVAPGEPFQSPLGPIRYPGDPLTPPSNHMNCRCVVFPRLMERNQ